MDEDIPKAIASKSLYRDREVALNREHDSETEMKHCVIACTCRRKNI